MIRVLTTAGVLLLLGGAGALGYRLAASRIAADIYRDRLRTLSSEYEDLRLTYNQAVRKTAITELIVRDGRLRVSISRPDGQRRTIDTPFDPGREIYCDYVLIDGRLWIRRVYDDLTAPADGLVLDSQFEFVDWTAPRARHGHAVYRQLAEGRWIVTVTGDGSLGLMKVEGDQPTPLTPAPQVHDFAEIEKQINARIDRIGPREVWQRLTAANP
jgi:hypothetical protein